LTPRQEASLAAQYYLIGRTKEQRRAIREKMLSFNLDTLRALAERLERALENSAWCIVASREELSGSDATII